MNTPSPQAVVILGAASGVARHIADQFARRGCALVLAGRDVAEIEVLAADLRARHDIPCHVLPFDALDFAAHEEFPSRCATVLDAPPDGVVLCFGFMADQAQAQENVATARRMIDTNLTGAVSILEGFAALFESRKHGFIAALSSVAGDRGRKMNYIYGASKAGLTTYLQGLRNRLHASGVRVTTIKPGFMDTPMTRGMALPKALVAAPEDAADAMVKAILRGRDVAYVPFFWRYIMGIIKSIPEWQFKKMSL